MAGKVVMLRVLLGLVLVLAVEVRASLIVPLAHTFQDSPRLFEVKKPRGGRRGWFYVCLGLLTDAVCEREANAKGQRLLVSGRAWVLFIWIWICEMMRAQRHRMFSDRTGCFSPDI